MTAGTTNDWLELAVEVDHEAVEPVTELFARYGYNEGVVIEEPFTQDPDGDNLAVDPARPVWVRTFVAAADVKSETLEQIKSALWHFGQMRRVGELQIETRKEEDWANAWKEHYRPIRAGRRVVISPPWHDFAPDRPDDVLVILDPGMAFGTGTHPSTRLCLTALEDVIAPGHTVFDVGTGTGVLAIAAAKMGASHVDAVDIEPVAVRATIDNAERNGVADLITVAEGSADVAPTLLGQYDVVLANIISRILVDISADLRRAVKPGGALILSGVIEGREPFVREAFEPFGFQLTKREQIDDWVGLRYRLAVE